MRGDVPFGGVILSPFVGQLLLAMILAGLLSYVLMRLNFYRLVWNRALVELAFFLIILGVIVLVSRGDRSLEGALFRAGRLG